MALKWYVLRAQSSREDRIKETLDKRIRAESMEGRVPRVLVPSENVSEIKGGHKRVTERKIYPGYIMAEIDVPESGEIPDDVWFLIRETPGIGDFVGGRRKPIPMEQREVDKILGEAEKKEEEPRLKISFKVSDSVRIKEGPFQNYDGLVEEVIPSKGMVIVNIKVFGRATPVELEYWQIEPV